MKAIILFLLVSIVSNAQKLTIEGIIPVKTYHFNRKEAHRYAEGEGGNAGLILSAIEKRKYLDNVYSFGYIRNSYGKWSMIATFGKNWNINQKLSLGVNIGFATNYKDAYKVTYWKDSEGEIFFEKTEGAKQKVGIDKNRMEMLQPLFDKSIIPVGAFTLKYKPSKHVGIIANVNPYYINAGLVLTLKRF